MKRGLERGKGGGALSFLVYVKEHPGMANRF